MNNIMNIHILCYINKGSLYRVWKSLGRERLRLYRTFFENFSYMNMDLSMNVADFPPVTNMDIVSYLVLTTSYYTNQQMKAYKSLNAFKNVESGFVTGCGVLKLVEKTVVLGKVKHSQKMNLAPLKVWLVCNEDGSVETAHCTCMAGLGEVCSHVGAVLYAVEHIVSSRDNTSCTDVRALWKVPSISKVDYVPLNDKKFGRIIPSPKSIVPALIPLEIVNTIENINSAKSSSVLMRIVEPLATQLAEEMGNRITVENPYTVVYREEYESYGLKELIDLASQINIEITNEECDLISHENLEVRSVGLCLVPQYPFFGASPDALVRKYCDFVIWNSRELFVGRIFFNEDFWLSESQKSIEFHKNVIMPELLGKFFTRNNIYSVSYCVCKAEDDGRPLISCDNENCNIQWYHMECIGILKVPDGVWYCPSCLLSSHT